MTTRVAVVQMVSGHVVADNLERARLRVLEAARGGAALVVLPEYFALMGLADTDKLAVAEAFGHGPMQDAVAQMAREAGVWLVAGTLPLAGQNPGRVRNSCLVFSPAGECVARYDKIHLFGFSGLGERYCESDTIEPGDTPVAVDTPLGRLGLSVCYDLRFPELYRHLGEMTALVLPAAFTAVTGEAHWEVLLRARAIENQCYAIAAAQGGVHSSGRRTHGHSMIIDPWGRIVAELPEGEGVLWADLDPALLASVRNRLPALRHRVLKCRA
ncbi:carbon-nitrogen hydrolase family protein [Laribacter hongkongensis]|uniref:carbon-nitrogen hydrolase family protein n=1 Tax=Laribacter hongkongensis TaxID=168471 RepID=UPI001EFE9008|nr:carbon-nitrogen hydrolase family protein [Laribacter hongkongensis]MCG8992318.1 carbon-nitrogen hydrolase family protein [Laribacter hongkongensis]MCG8997452.1 carbon-nitrogen hydrolase family protein [Laribacter hongkongensis]MCG9000153.1 carbon-nitrogen hydrolase family protein [Laribacter hongkongensis]MCG9003599.1 carbon-nitrogen hydrolase family protein [Laribacter hongkongensis]MCG9008347.1 carbon-nitrogen hydrolase family protein [Laribacter hongkongensis]